MRERDDGKSPDFEVNLGRVISTLREDYPRILTDPPSFDIFTDEIELRDPVRVYNMELELAHFSFFWVILSLISRYDCDGYVVRVANRLPLAV